MKKQKVNQNTKSVENESGCLQEQSFPRTAQDRICPVDSSSRKAMSLNEPECASAHERRILGGIGESRNRDSESGRSMVEMLGVLAIMGVLVIGGVAGYRWAMDKYNANEILNEVRKRAVTVSQQRILGQPIDLSEWSTTIQGHPVTTADNYNGNTSFFALTVAGIEKGVCDKVIAEKIPFVVEEKIGDVVVEEETVCAEGSNDVTFAFNNTLLETEAPDPRCAGITCPAGSRCEAGRCYCTIDNRGVCGQMCCAEGYLCASWASVDQPNCVPVQESSECTSNKACAKLEKCQGKECFCNFDAGWTGSICSGHKGLCSETQRALTVEGKNGVTYYYPQDPNHMSYWTAVSWCESLTGKNGGRLHLASVEEACPGEDIKTTKRCENLNGVASSGTGKWIDADGLNGYHGGYYITFSGSAGGRAKCYKSNFDGWGANALCVE